MITFPLITILLLVSFPSIGQDDQTKTSEQERAAEALKTFTQEQGADKALQMYGVEIFQCDKEKEEQAHKACVLAREAYYDYYAKGLPRRTKEYEWNNFSTRVIFVVVLGLVSVGVYFSWKQFFFDRKVKESGTEERSPDKGPPQSPITELEIGLAGIKLKSSILGVILLTVSLAFFYLYLKYVYPVTAHF